MTRELASLVASKIFFHLEEHDQALRLGLGAGSYFDVSAKTEFVETLVAKAIDQYIHLREDKPQGEDAPPMDPRLEAIVEKMFNR